MAAHTRVSVGQPAVTGRHTNLLALVCTMPRSMARVDDAAWIAAARAQDSSALACVIRAQAARHFSAVTRLREDGDALSAPTTYPGKTGVSRGQPTPSGWRSRPSDYAQRGREGVSLARQRCR